MEWRKLLGEARSGSASGVPRGGTATDQPNGPVGRLKFTGYFEAIRLRQDRAMILLEWVQHVIEHPVRETIQADGRIRRYLRARRVAG